MKRLEAVHLVQFSFFEAESFETRGNLTLLGPNGVGKTSILDAIQIAMLGAHGTYLAFNSQSVSSQQKRTLKDYCLGTMRSGGDSPAGAVRKRDHAQSFITLIFRDSETGEPVSAGICLSATVLEPQHRLRGLYVLPGAELSLKDHLQAVEEGTAPLEWSAFQVELQRQAKAVKRTPHVSVHPESYIEELLHSLQPSARHIDRHAFVRAFKKSMQLKDIESVNDFVRDYLIDAQPINKQTALTQITRFRQLKTLIEETEEQIDRLKQIHKDQTSLLEASQRRDTVVAVKALLALENAEAALKATEKDLVDAQDELAKTVPKVKFTESLKAELNRQVQDLIARISADPDAAKSEQNRKLMEALQRGLADNRRELSAKHLRIREALQHASQCLAKSNALPARAADALLGRWDALAQRQEAAKKDLRSETIQLFDGLAPLVKARYDEAGRTESVAETKLKALLGQAKGASMGAGKLGSSAGFAIELFREEGIEAKPICALIEVRDRTWQGAIEAFLGRHREALVVQNKKERDAVILIRKHRKDADWPFDVTVVQPMHLDIARHRTPGKDTVAALIIGSDEVAVTYVRQIFGGMKCVDTEDELERHARSLTRDGMLSANGGTRRLRIPDSERWLIGSKVSDVEQRELQRAAVRAHQELNDAKQATVLASNAVSAVQQARDTLSGVGYAEVSSSIEQVIAELAGVPAADAAVESHYLVKLRKEKAEADQALSDAEEKLKKIRGTETRLVTLIEERTKQIETQKAEAAAKRAEHETAISAGDFDAVLHASMQEQIVKGAQEDRFRACDEIRIGAEKRIDTLRNKVIPAFSGFLDHYNVSLIEERSDWRKARTWVEARISKLELSELVAHKEDAKNALNAAEEAFRRDVAYRLREAIQRLEQGILNLNKILSACPVFSGNERYQFVAKPAEAHRKVYDFIRNVDREESQGSLLSDTEGTRVEILQLLEISASPDAKRVQNPLEDYRLLFNFDLAILQDGKEVDRLSKRIGVASNGEHRVPFYVIAGAALAAAYRIAPNKPIDGAALMLLDEAFYGMDSQNCFAAAEFLHSLGLQLIMAGPEADLGKLLPVTNTLYEMVRYGGDVFFEHEHFAEEMKRVMTSDMPMLNPGLIDEAERSLPVVAR